MDKHYTLNIVIDGESADALFAAGPTDLKDSLLPEHLFVDSKDIKQITFSKVTERSEYGVPTMSNVHKDNYVRSENKL